MYSKSHTIYGQLPDLTAQKFIIKIGDWHPFLLPLEIRDSPLFLGELCDDFFEACPVGTVAF
jgi:hypothetical protein